MDDRRKPDQSGLIERRIPSDDSFAGTRLFFVRHAQTAANARGRVCGITDLPLDRIGQIQGRALEQAFRETPLTAAYASPLRRAVETARLALGQKSVPLNLLPELREAEMGQWEGLRFLEIERRWPGTLRALKQDAQTLQIPGLAESWQHAQARVLHAVSRVLRENAGGRVLVVTHGYLLKFLFAALLETPLGSFERVRLGGNASVTVLDAEKDGTFTIRLWGETGQLPLLMRGNPADRILERLLGSGVEWQGARHSAYLRLEP